MPVYLALPDASTRPAAVTVGISPRVSMFGRPSILPQRVWEHQIEIRLGAGQPPLPQRVKHDWPEWNLALASLRLGRANLVELVGALSHVQLVGLQVHVSPAQAPKLRSTQASEGGNQEQRTPTALSVCQDG